MRPPSIPTALNRLPGVFFLLGAWQVLLGVQNPGIAADDSGETVAAAFTLGIPHPPGYPLHTLLARLALFLPVGTPAFRLNLLASLFTLGALLLLMDACRRMAARLDPPLPFGRTVLYLLSAFVSLLTCEFVFAQSLTAKGGVYTLTLLLLAVFLRSFFRRVPPFGAEAFLFLWALSLANHWQTALLWAPLLGALIRGAGHALTARRVFLSAAFFLTGLSVYLVLPLRAALQPGVNWEDPRTIDAFLRLVLRAPYAAREFFQPFQAAGVAIQARAFLEVLALHAWPGLLLLAVLGALALRWNRSRVLAPLLASAGLTAAALVLVLRIPRDTPFYMGNYTVAFQALLVFLGFAGLLALDRLLSEGKPRWAWILAFLSVAAPLAWGVKIPAAQDKSRYLLAHDYGLNQLLEIPRGAASFTRGDQNLMPVLYHRLVEGRRPDLEPFPIFHFETGWGWERIRRAWDLGDPEDLRFAAGKERFEHTLDRLILSSAPFLYAEDVSRLEEVRLGVTPYPLVPWGLNHRFEAAPPPPREVARRVRAVTGAWRLRSLYRAVPSPPTELPRSLFVRYYAHPLFSTGRYLLKLGADREGYGLLQAALDRDPDLPEMRLYLAKHFLNRRDYELALVFCREEAEREPDRAEPWEVLGTILLILGDNDGAIEGFRRALKLDPSSKVASDNLPVALRAESAGRRVFNRIVPPADYYLRMAEGFAEAGCPLFADAARKAAQTSRTDGTRRPAPR